MNNFGLFCRALEKKLLFWFFERWLECRKKPNVPFVRLAFTLSDNVPRLCEVADFQHKCSFEKRNLNLALNCHRSTKPAILQNRCYAFALLFLSSVLLSFLVGFVCVGKASSFAIFGLCVGLCELQMCLLLAWAFL